MTEAAFTALLHVRSALYPCPIDLRPTRRAGLFALRLLLSLAAGRDMRVVLIARPGRSPNLRQSRSGNPRTGARPLRTRPPDSAPLANRISGNLALTMGARRSRFSAISSPGTYLRISALLVASAPPPPPRSEPERPFHASFHGAIGAEIVSSQGHHRAEIEATET